MATPINPVTGPTDRVGPEVAKLRNELQQVGASVRSGPLPAAALDLVEFTPVQATPQAMLYDSFRALGQALQTGDLKTVQSAYRALAKAMQTASLGAGTPFAATATLTVLADASRALRQAVQTGDLTGAQQAYAALRQSLQNVEEPARQRLIGERAGADSDRGDPVRPDRPLTAQQAYWLVQQEMAGDTRLDSADEVSRQPGSKAESYSLHLLLAANRPAQEAAEAQSEGGWRNSPLGSTVFWWSAANLVAILCLSFTGLLQFTVASAVPVLIALAVLNVLLVMAFKFS